MANVTHPILGAIDPSGPGFWDATITFAEHGVFFDLTIDRRGADRQPTSPIFRSSPRNWSHSTVRRVSRFSRTR